MSFRKTHSMLLLAGVVATINAGCITGTNTFSSTLIPETRYCSSGEDSIDIMSADLNRRHEVEPEFDRVSLREEACGGIDAN